MNKKFILFATLLTGLAISGCKHTTQGAGNVASGTSNSTESTEVNKQTANTAAQIYAKPQIPILCYHRIEDGKKGDYTVTPATFSAHMKILADSGYHSVSPAQLYDYLVYNKELPTKPFLITFDD